MVRLVGVVALVLLAGQAAAAATAASRVSLSEINPRQAYENMQDTFQKNPDMLAAIYYWLVAGFILLILGTVLLLFSEINTVLVCRDQDFRTRLIEGQHAEPSDSREYQMLVDREKMVLAPRPYLTLLAVVLLVLAHSCMLFPLCDLLRILGLPSAPCILLITFGACFGAITVASFWMFVVWSCTRMWAALVFLLIAFTGAVMLPGGNPILLMLWVSIAFGAFYAYFVYLPSLYPDAKDYPFWLQSVGPYDLDPTVDNFRKALNQGALVLSMEAQESLDSIRRASENAAARAANPFPPKTEEPAAPSKPVPTGMI